MDQQDHFLADEIPSEVKNNRSRLYEFGSNNANEIKAKFPDIKRGDVVTVDINGYRNENRYIWTGENLIDLYFDVIDYGSIPPEFTFAEFPDPHYFADSINHNYLFWVPIIPENISKDDDRVILDVTFDGKEYKFPLETVDEYDEYKITDSVETIYDKLTHHESGVVALEVSADDEKYYMVY